MEYGNGNRKEKHTPDKIAAKCDLLIDIDTFESIDIYWLIELFVLRAAAVCDLLFMLRHVNF